MGYNYMTWDRGQRTEGIGQGTQNGGNMTKVRGQKEGDKQHRTEEIEQGT